MHNIGDVFFFYFAIFFIFQVYNSTSNTTMILKCTLVRSEHFMDQIWYWLDLAKFVLLPSALLTTSNIIIVSAMTRRHHYLDKVFSFRGNSLSSSSNRQSATSSSKSHQARANKKDIHPKSVYHVSREHLNLTTSSGSTGSTLSRIIHAKSREETDVIKQVDSRQSGADNKSLSAWNTSGKAKGKISAGNSNSNSRLANNSNSLTVTLVAVNVTFVVCNAPVMVFLLNRDGWFEPHQGAAYSLTWTVVVMAMYTNNALNFVLYCATGSKFRAEMRALFASCRFSSTSVSRGSELRARFGEHSHCSESSDGSVLSTSVSSSSRGTASAIKNYPSH